MDKQHLIQTTSEVKDLDKYLSFRGRLIMAKAAPISRDELERRIARAILRIDSSYLAMLKQSGVNVPMDFWNSYREDLRREISSPMRQYIEQSFTNYSDYVAYIDKTGAVGDIDTLMTRAITDAADGIANTTRNNLEGLISQGIPTDEIIDRIALRFGSGHAEQVAVTEITRAEGFFSEALSSRLAEQGVTTQIRWLTAEDERVCPICGPLDHVLKQFGGWMTKGGMISGPPAHPNCRCQTVVETKK